MCLTIKTMLTKITQFTLEKHNLQYSRIGHKEIESNLTSMFVILDVQKSMLVSKSVLGKFSMDYCHQSISLHTDKTKGL